MRFMPLSMTLAALIAAACTPSVTVPATPISLTEAQNSFARTAMAIRLQDPASAQFQDITAYALPNGGRIICGMLNARNGFGSYNGFAPFYLRLRNDAVVRAYHDDGSGYGPAFIGCTRAAEGLIAVSG